MVLSTALFGKPAFRNLICNGLVLAEDGKKMSKRLKNYPSPMGVIGDYGAVRICQQHSTSSRIVYCYISFVSSCTLLFLDVENLRGDISIFAIIFTVVLYLLHTGCFAIIPYKFASCPSRTFAVQKRWRIWCCKYCHIFFISLRVLS